MENCPQIAEKEHTFSGDDGEDYLSDGSEHQSHGFLVTPIMEPPVHVGDDPHALSAGIEALSRGQAILIEKITFLEKIVGTVQFDMTWVRDDMKLVNQAMGKFGSEVCDTRGAEPVVEVFKEQESEDARPPQTRKGKEQVQDFPRPPSLSTSLVERACAGDSLPYSTAGGNEAGQCAEERQPYVNHAEAETNIQAVPATGRRDWGYASVASPEVGSPVCQQIRKSTEKDLMQDETQEFEMSCQSTPLQMTATGPSMWSNFADAVRDWPPQAAAGTRREEGCAMSKKGRWDSTEHGKDYAEALREPLEADNLFSHLNSLLHNPGTTTTGGGIPTPSMCSVDASKKGSAGTWRGTAGARRPPASQPRYHTQVRVGRKKTVGRYVCMLLHRPHVLARHSA